MFLKAAIAAVLLMTFLGAFALLIAACLMVPLLLDDLAPIVRRLRHPLTAGATNERRCPRCGVLLLVVLSVLCSAACTATVCTYQQVPYTDADGSTLWIIQTCYPKTPIGQPAQPSPTAPRSSRGSAPVS